MAKYLKNTEHIDQINRSNIFQGLLVSDKSESVNKHIHTDQQKIKFHILGIRRADELIRQRTNGYGYSKV